MISCTSWKCHICIFKYKDNIDLKLGRESEINKKNLDKFYNRENILILHEGLDQYHKIAHRLKRNPSRNRQINNQSELKKIYIYMKFIKTDHKTPS